jgi:carboxymethylenebutenolidase
MGEVVSFATASGDGQGHFAVAAGPGLLLVPDARGLTPPVVAAAERLAAAGVATLAVDLLRGRGAWIGAYEDSVGHFLTRDLADIAADISGAARFLLDHPMVTGDRVGAAGAGGGGAMALWAAAICPAIGAVSAAYPARSLWRLEGIRPQALTGCHTVLHLAAADREFGVADADRLGTTLCDRRYLEVHTYPGTLPGFLDDTRPDLFHPAAAELVWQRVMASVVAMASSVARPNISQHHLTEEVGT